MPLFSSQALTPIWGKSTTENASPGGDPIVKQFILLKLYRTNPIIKHIKYINSFIIILYKNKLIILLMKLFELDSTHNKIIEEINLINPIIDEVMHKNLMETKKLIDKYQNKWDRYKKNNNDYEYVYTMSSNIRKNICNISPISRSYFKLHEILQDLNILDDYLNITITCMAEGPGGFIQNLLYNCNKKNIQINNLYGITLLSDTTDIPYWCPIIINNNIVTCLDGNDKTGNICNIDNQNDFISKINKRTCDIITADGGIDYTNNYNEQESDSYQFIYSEILIALQIQKNKGSFIIKMFDLLYHNTIQLIYILYLCYDKIIISKPYTSRNTNSEKYIVCKGYKYNKDIIQILNKYKSSINQFYINIPESFKNNIRIYNSLYINKQIKNINAILNNIRGNYNIIDRPTMKQIQNAKEWCNTYNMQVNKKCMYI